MTYTYLYGALAQAAGEEWSKWRGEGGLVFGLHLGAIHMRSFNYKSFLVPTQVKKLYRFIYESIGTNRIYNII